MVFINHSTAYQGKMSIYKIRANRIALNVTLPSKRSNLSIEIIKFYLKEERGEALKYLTSVSLDSSGYILLPKEIIKTCRIYSREVEWLYSEYGIYMNTVVKKPTTGLIRKIISRGKVNIPAPYRRELRWQSYMSLEIFQIAEGYFYFQAAHCHCIFCCNSYVDDLIAIQGKYICKNCLQEAIGKHYMLAANNKF
ncbi:hypothetical protein GCM10011391_38530 [Pullulanibacillus camelliae]|uniref:SpoVT-AbrB domain-containing protein n=1 Tax=Pullulanibacillus camelliae TaxID=1707096 RepID=A0A8J3E0Z3_9BACL|nr:hypothetical protein [Pullulanibacillus camelliae]GGE55850.1 hypothetical protein GCM10011391_38530 [Pullulanibacillus camelliae]